MRNSKLTKEKVKRLKEQQKVLRNKLIPEKSPTQSRGSFGVFSAENKGEYKGKSLRDMKTKRLQKKQGELKKPLQKKSLMFMFK